MYEYLFEMATTIASSLEKEQGRKMGEGEEETKEKNMKVKGKRKLVFNLCLENNAK